MHFSIIRKPFVGYLESRKKVQEGKKDNSWQPVPEKELKISWEISAPEKTYIYFDFYKNIYPKEWRSQ